MEFKLSTTQQLLEGIDTLTRQRERIVVAIDGMSAAGKSSLAAMLQDIYSCEVVSMDSFFLREAQRTPERLGSPGGNIDYERFAAEVTEPLSSGSPFTYRPYDCQTGELSSFVTVNPKPLIVVEGVYSMHPNFAIKRSVYDIRVFMGLSGEEQRSRLSVRSPALYERFINEWIPMENRYFEHFGIPEKCDYILWA